MLYEKFLTTMDEIKTFSDPFRIKVLLTFGDGEEPLTVKQISVKLGEVPAKVHYHVKELERIGVLEIVDTREKSGILEKYYLPTAQSFKIDKSIRTALGSDGLNLMGDTVLDSLNEEYKRFKSVSKDCTDKTIMNIGTVYLSDEEFEELDNIVTEYVNSKKKRKGTKPYVHGLILFRKYDDGNYHGG
ncbi:MAG: helix-turn-helix domain-containing protein [Caulobacteraceae bacterium]